LIAAKDGVRRQVRIEQGRSWPVYIVPDGDVMNCEEAFVAQARDVLAQLPFDGRGRGEDVLIRLAEAGDLAGGAEDLARADDDHHQHGDGDEHFGDSEARLPLPPGEGWGEGARDGGRRSHAVGTLTLPSPKGRGFTQR
jgi:hypothetical protein